MDRLPRDLERELGWLRGFYYRIASTGNFGGMSAEAQWATLRASIVESPTSWGLRHAQLELIDQLNVTERAAVLQALKQRRD